MQTKSSTENRREACQTNQLDENSSKNVAKFRLETKKLATCCTAENSCKTFTMTSYDFYHNLSEIL